MFATKILLAMLTMLGYAPLPMATKTKNINENGKLEVTVGTRVPTWVREFYERQANAERRKLGAVIRNVLVDAAMKKRAA
jgi:hypothetical protein